MSDVTVNAIDDSKNSFERPLLTGEEMFKTAAKLDSQLKWTLNEESKEYIGEAPFGSFRLHRNANGRLEADFKHATDATYTATIHFPNDSTIATARANATLRIVEHFNQTRRDDPLLADSAVDHSEPDAF